MKRASVFRRYLLGSLATAMLALPVASTSGCTGDYLPRSLVNGLRVFNVQADNPYALPGEKVTFRMGYYDGHPEGPRQVQILWIGGCFNPPGDQYYGCFAQMAQVFEGLADGGGAPGGPMISDFIGFGDTFTTTIPEDIVSSRPAPEGGSKYGLGYVFFAACAGQIQPIEIDPGGSAGFFPLGCFDAETGERLPADSFVPGVTVVYSFEDGRRNENPVTNGLKLDGEPMSEDFAEIPVVKPCPSTTDERRATGCFAGEPYEGCHAYRIDVDIAADVAELDPEAIVNGQQIREAVWGTFLVDGGDFLEGATVLISGVTEGFKEDHSVTWVPPAEPGLYSIWFVVRDTRGGSSMLQRYIRVE
jgi:hypothetical protein